MSRQRRILWLLPTMISLFLFTLFIPGQADAVIGKENLTGPVAVITEKNPPVPSSVPAVEEAIKQSIPNKAAQKTDKKREAAQNAPPKEKNKKELHVEQEMMENALELLNYSQESWVEGDIENALEALDQAYALILDTNGDPDIARQKDDLRLLIAKKIFAVYNSKQPVIKGRKSEVPLVMNAEVEREIRSFQTVERDYFINSYQRSAIFRPTVLAALKKAGLPEELSWLPLVESGFKVRALSTARALGLWQFIPSTGYKYGLSRDAWIDERMDVEKATQAAIAYLKDLHDMFGDWLTVLAAYNCGEGRVMRVIAGQHIEYLDHFWDLYKKLPNETARYVPRFLATLQIIKDPQKYGFNLETPPENQFAYAYDSVTTDKMMNLRDIASCLGMSEDQLCLLNAELKLNKTPDKEYGLKVPPAFLEKFAQIKDEIPIAEKPRQSETRRVATIRHKVRRGESLSGIAKRYGTTPGAIRTQNKSLAKRNLRVGQQLLIAVRGNQPAKVAEKEERKADKSGQANVRFSYKVKKGDTLHSLAQRFDTSVNEIKKINNIKGTSLKIGQTLRLDKKASAESEKGGKRA